MLLFSRNFSETEFAGLQSQFQRQIYVSLLAFEQRLATSAALSATNTEETIEGGPRNDSFFKI